MAVTFVTLTSMKQTFSSPLETSSADMLADKCLLTVLISFPDFGKGKVIYFVTVKVSWKCKTSLSFRVTIPIPLRVLRILNCISLWFVTVL